MSKSRSVDNGKNFWISAALGAMVSFIITFVLMALMAAFISSGKLSQASGAQSIFLCAFIGSFVGATFAKIRNKERSFPLSMAVTGIALLIKLIVSAFSSTGSIFDGRDIVIMVSILLGGLSSAFIRFGSKKRRRA